MDDFYKNIEEHNPNKKRKILIVFDYIIADMLNNKKFNPFLTISIVFITHPYFAVPKNNRLNSMHYFMMKIPNNQELQQLVFNHPTDIDLKEFTNFLKKCTTFESDKPFRIF